MKDPKALFPLLFASSWLGNLLLTILAFYLAFSHSGPLSPLIFLTVALCILSGNALPIAVYLIMVRWRALELKAESTEVALRVREGLLRSEDLVGRLDEAEGALAKGILVARQVPERIRESFEAIQDLGSQLEAMEVSSLSEALRGQSDALGSIRGSVDDLSKAVKLLEKDVSTIGKDVRSVPSALSRLVEDLPSTPAGEPAEGDVAVGERMDLLFETLESVQDSLDALLQRVAAIQGQESAVQVETGGEGELESELELETELETEGESELELESELEVEAEPELELGDESEPFELADGQTRLVAHAMIGMRNKLYIRGDQPWLSWEDGQMMQLVGIGEFSWSIDNIKEPIEVTVLLNDEYEAKEGTVMLKPGKTVRINPTFPSV